MAANAADTYKNPDFLANTGSDDDYLTSEFGLFQNYRQGTRNNYNEYQLLMNEVDGVQNKLNVIEDAVKSFEESATGYGDVLLYNENLKKKLAEVEAKQADNNTLAEGYKAKNQAEIEMIAQQLEWKTKLAADIKAVEDLIEPAKKDILSLKLVDADNNTLTGDFTPMQNKLELVKERLEAVYLAAALTAGTELNGNKGVWNSTAYKDGSAIVVPAIDGLTAIKDLINAEVQKHVDMRADQELAKAKAAYDAAIEVLTTTEMKKATREKLEGDFYGNTSTGEYDGGFQQEYAEFRDTKAAQTIGTIFDYIGAIADFIDRLTNKETGFIDNVQDEKFGDINNGDGTGDGVVDVRDLAFLIDLVTNPSHVEPLTQAAKDAADLNSDGQIDVTDLSIMLDVMNGKTPAALATSREVAADKRFNETLTADVVATEGNRMRIAISLNNWRPYFTFQMDVKMPKGMKLVDQSLSDRATTQTLYANDWSGKTRIVAFTMGRDVFEGDNGAVLYLDVETDENYNGGSIQYSNIVFTTIESQGVKFQLGNDNTTGIMSRMANAAKQTIYNLGGRVMDGLKKGVNIISGNGKSEKVIKK
jgi:hypothetical protein